MIVHANGDGKSEDKLPTKKKKSEIVFNSYCVISMI